LSGLLRPHEFADPESEENEDSAEPQLWELPDTSILFRRYLDSGKMINVYDWFESFQFVLETQRKHLQKERVGEQGSPKKKSGKGKGREKQVTRGAEEDDEEEAEEKWKMEVQARFMRALQELDYLGFIKHTGRKADHVQRTVFDIPD
jgi:origin recognition complex subunit 3